MLHSVQLKYGSLLKSKKLKVFGLFFMMSLLILVVTKLSETYVETVSFDVEYKNLPDNNSIILDSVPTIDVTMSTHGFNLLSYYFQDKKYELDLAKSSYTTANNYVWLANTGLYDFKQLLGKKVNIISVKPDTLILPFGILGTKKVPLVLKSKINFALGYDSFYGVVVKPDSISIMGASSDLGKVNYIETKSVILNNVKSNISSNIELDLQNYSNKLKFSEQSVGVFAEVEKFTEGTFDIPITLVNVPNDVVINYFPKQIKVSYYLSLNDYKEVKASAFSIQCNYNEVFKSENLYFTPKLIVNDAKVKIARMKQNKVEYIIK